MKILSEAQRLKAIAEIIEGVDLRCSAYDGDVGETRQEITAAELLKIYRLASGYGLRKAKP